MSMYGAIFDLQLMGIVEGTNIDGEKLRRVNNREYLDAIEQAKEECKALLLELAKSDKDYMTLKAENAKLRAERDEWHRVSESKQDIIDHMRDARAENAKLRELMTFYIRCLTKGHVNCDSCSISKECGSGDMVITEAIKLGIEVNK